MDELFVLKRSQLQNRLLAIIILQIQIHQIALPRPEPDLLELLLHLTLGYFILPLMLPRIDEKMLLYLNDASTMVHNLLLLLVV